MPTQLTEGVDYTIENGRWVFTAKFLRDRGYCCGSGCRNCPYRSCASAAFGPAVAPEGSDESARGSGLGR